MRVLILSQYYWPESFRINEVVDSLREAGCEVTVLTGQPNYPEGRTYPGYRAWSFGREHERDYPIYRVPLAPRGTASGLRMAVNYLSFVLTGTLVGRWLLRGQRFEVILVYGMSPILQAIPGLFLKGPKRAALVTWVQDLWPESIAVAGFVRSPWLLSQVGAIVRWIYRRSDLLLVQSQAFIPAVRSMAGGTPIIYHPNPGELTASDMSDAVDSGVTLKPGFNVVFAGNMGTVQALDTVLAAAERLLPYPDIRLVLIGSGSRRSWLVQEATTRRLNNVQFIDRQSPRAMPSLLGQASALLVTLVRDPTMGMTVPSKIQAYLAAGRPIIACLDGEGARVVAEAGAGFTCAAEDAEALAQTVISMQGLSAEKLQKMGDDGRNYYHQHFDPGRLAQRLLGYFREISGGSASA
jgi:glycosyltransferase involved in cell wall biosynthesis